MYYQEEHRRAHFHVRSPQGNASIDLRSGAVLAGSLPPGKLREIKEWADKHKRELRDNWKRARRGEELSAIDGTT